HYYRNFDTSVRRRVPDEDEMLVARERSSNVKFDPGDDVETAAYATMSIPYWSFGYRFGMNRHFGDRYSGSLEGNYDKLSENSDSKEIYHEFSAGFDTIKAFQRRKFIYPFTLTLTRHMPIYAMNTYNNEYWQLSLMGFFGRR